MSKTTDYTPELDDVWADAEALAALSDGFRHFDDPEQSLPIERNVINELTSGRDFDPWYRQLAHRAAWMAVPAVVAFGVAYAALSLFRIPPISALGWPNRPRAEAVATMRDDADKLYVNAPAVASVSVSVASHGSTGSNSMAPKWWKDPELTSRERAISNRPNGWIFIPTLTHSRSKASHK